MAKTKKVYICSNCGSNYAKMMGKCVACGEFNTVLEEIVEKPKAATYTVYLALMGLIIATELIR